MKFKQIAVFVVVGLFATLAWSGPDAHHKMKIVISDDEGDGEMRIELDSDDLGFSLHEMQVGENQSVVDKQGRAILITRNEDGYTLEVDGKTVDIPAFAPHGRHGGQFCSDADVDVRVMHDGAGPRGMLHGDGVFIVSRNDIDDATQQVIRDALTSAGHDSVHFAGGHGDGNHQVRVIKRVVEVTE